MRDNKDNRDNKERREHMEGINKFLHGTIWLWNNPAERKEGVQAGDRPVLIISNDTFNKFSRAVNCVSITTILKQSRVHEPVYITRPSHIQCEQLHTIPKDELIEYYGKVEPSTLSNVKAKIRIQFDMGEDRNSDTIAEIRKIVGLINNRLNDKNAGQDEAINDTKNLEELLEKSRIENLSILKSLEKAFGLLLDETGKVASALGRISGVDVQGDVQSSENILALPESKNQSRKSNQPITEKLVTTKTPTTKTTRNKYTHEDMQFIVDSNNSIEAIMKRYSFTKKQSAYAARSYAKKVLSGV